MTVRPLRIIVSATPPRAREYYPVGSLQLLPGLALWAGALVLPQEFRSWATQLLAIVGWLLVGVLAAQAILQRLLARRLRAMWPHAGGLCCDYGRRLPPVLIIQWPRPTPLPLAATLVYRLEQEAALTYLLAHEYAHSLLRARYRQTELPVWWNEGFASWFAEQVMGAPFWRPESRECLSVREPRGNPRRLLRQDDYLRLCARYYWEVRQLADEGRLPEVLGAFYMRIDSFRPKLAPTDQVAPRT